MAALFGRQGIDPDLKRALGGIAQVAEAGGIGGGSTRLHGAGGLNGPGESIGGVGIEIKGRKAGEGIGMKLKGAQVVEPHITSDPADPVGALDAELIRQVIHSHHDQIRYCYEQVLTQAPDLGGKVAVHFVISADGSVSASNVTQSNTSSAQLDACVMGRARTWVFPKPKGGGLVSVTYPFIFKVAGK